MRSWDATALSEEVFVETCCGVVVEIRCKRGRRGRKDEKGGGKRGGRVEKGVI